MSTLTGPTASVRWSMWIRDALVSIHMFFLASGCRMRGGVLLSERRLAQRMSRCNQRWREGNPTHLELWFKLQGELPGAATPFGHTTAALFLVKMCRAGNGHLDPRPRTHGRFSTSRRRERTHCLGAHPAAASAHPACSSRGLGGHVAVEMCSVRKWPLSPNRRPQPPPAHKAPTPIKHPLG